MIFFSLIPMILSEYTAFQWFSNIGLLLSASPKFDTLYIRILSLSQIPINFECNILAYERHWLNAFCCSSTDDMSYFASITNGAFSKCFSPFAKNTKSGMAFSFLPAFKVSCLVQSVSLYPIFLRKGISIFSSTSFSIFIMPKFTFELLNSLGSFSVL